MVSLLRTTGSPKDGKGTIAEHWDLDIDDAHEVFLSYLDWKSDQPGSNVTKTLSEAEQQELENEREEQP